MDRRTDGYPRTPGGRQRPGTSDLGAAAAKRLLERRGIAATEIDLIIVATVTPDMFFPSTACLVQHKIGASKAWDLIFPARAPVLYTH
jgi:3-oxoacyl-[acyl-carrier-protein] synthase III